MKKLHLFYFYILLITVPVFALDSLVLSLKDNTRLVLIRIPKGSFIMGSQEPAGSQWSTCDWDPSCDKPAHKVTINYDFYIGKYEVTQEQWKTIMDTIPNEKFNQCVSCPVSNVSWKDCHIFFKKLAQSVQSDSLVFRLPSEAEWEYACRAGSTTRYYFGDTGCMPTAGDSCLLNDYAWWGANNIGKVHPVGLRKPNKFGLYDMLGNVYEWCEDNWHFSYSGAPTDGRPWMDGDTSWKSIRGAWRGYHEARKFVSCFRARHENYFDFRHDCCGMRLAAGIVYNSPARTSIRLRKVTRNGIECTKLHENIFRFITDSNAPIRIFDLRGSMVVEIKPVAEAGLFSCVWNSNQVFTSAKTACFIVQQKANDRSPRFISIIK